MAEMKRYKSLVVSYLSPYPPISGGAQQALAELKVLSAFSEVDLLTFYEVSDVNTPNLVQQHLSPICNIIECVPVDLFFARHRLRQILLFLGSLTGSEPFRLQKLWVPSMQARFRQMISQTQYHIILFNHLAVARYASLIPENYPAVKILTEANIEWEIFERHAQNARNPFRRLIARYEAHRLKRAEVAWANRFDGIHALSERDRDILQANGVVRPIHIFRRPMQVLDPPITTFETSEPWVISLGRLDETRTPGTLWFAEQVWHKVLTRCPDAHWHIIGADPPPSVQALNGKDHITVHGYVKDLQPILRKTRVCIIPLFIGGGIRIKILDMLSQGIPCVSTTVGAQGLENEGVLIADEPDAFADAVVKVLTQSELWKRMQTQGQEFLRRNYSPEVVIESERQFIEALIASTKIAERGGS